MIAQSNMSEKSVRLSCLNQTRLSDKPQFSSYRVTEYICIVVAYFIEQPRLN